MFPARACARLNKNRHDWEEDVSSNRELAARTAAPGPGPGSTSKVCWHQRDRGASFKSGTAPHSSHPTTRGTKPHSRSGRGSLPTHGCAPSHRRRAHSACMNQPELRQSADRSSPICALIALHERIRALVSCSLPRSASAYFSAERTQADSLQRHPRRRSEPALHPGDAPAVGGGRRQRSPTSAYREFRAQCPGGTTSLRSSKRMPSWLSSARAGP